MRRVDGLAKRLGELQRTVAAHDNFLEAQFPGDERIIISFSEAEAAVVAREWARLKQEKPNG